jgi:predicted Zn-dependent peptidase
MKLSQAGDNAAFNLYFGGDMSSLVFQEIREFRSLAYSTSANHQLAKKENSPNYFYAYLGCQGDKTPEAIQVMHELITKMPIKREREDGIRSALISNAKTNKPGFRDLIQVVEMWEKMGYTEDPNINLLPYYSDLTFNQIENFYKNEIEGKNLQLFVVGNSKKFDTKILEKYGKLTRVKSSQILKN